MSFRITKVTDERREPGNGGIVSPITKTSRKQVILEGVKEFIDYMLEKAKEKKLQINMNIVELEDFDMIIGIVATWGDRYNATPTATIIDFMTSWGIDATVFSQEELDEIRSYCNFMFVAIKKYLK
jgi:hypothetical protein